MSLPADLAETATPFLGPNDAVTERPWGVWVDWHRTGDATLKFMIVRPGHRMSLQRHRDRAEVWRVIQGQGEDQAADPPRPLLPGDTCVIEPGQVHRIANPGTEPLCIVEMQLGTCSEDDIERLADDYQRGDATPTPQQPL